MTTLVILACLMPVGLVAAARLAYRLGCKDEAKRGDRRAVESFARGFNIGRQAGGDELANAYLAAAADRDPLDAWPKERRAERLPS